MPSLTGGASRRGKRATSAGTIALINPTVKVLRDAGEPLPRREIVKRLGTVPAAADYRLRKAVAARFVEKLGCGRYRVSHAVPAL